MKIAKYAVLLLSLEAAKLNAKYVHVAKFGDNSVSAYRAAPVTRTGNPGHLPIDAVIRVDGHR
jgi:hypothetical protein